MRRYVKTFRVDTIDGCTLLANTHAAQCDSDLISAQLSFVGSGNAFEKPVLTCVFEKRVYVSGEQFDKCDSCVYNETCEYWRRDLARECGCGDYEEHVEKAKKKPKKG